jgi:predicted AAA+ superfamily ATPase
LDKSEVLAILNDWNYWNKDFPSTKKRSFYDEKITNFLKNDEVVVIKGIRRSGKSTLMINQIEKLVASGVSINDILIINLEDPRFINNLNLELLQTIKDTYIQYLNPSSKPYVFLDEVQNIPQWEKWVNKEYELKLSHLIITGSNSSMLSSEIASSLSGRYLSIDVYPLSFKEYLEFKDITINSLLDLVNHKIILNREFERFIRDGGFPKLVSYEQEQKNDLLTTYKDSILLKDIVARYKLNDFHTLEEISAFILSNTGIIQSTNKLKNTFNISFDMASSYLEYLKNAYMIFEIKKFDYSLKKQNSNEKKYYSVDLGLSNLMRVPNLQTRGADLETIVFLELLRRGYKIYYYKTLNNLECDFIVEKNNKIQMLIQVCKTLKDEKTQKRELSPFSKTIEELQLKDVQLLVITEDSNRNQRIDNYEVKIINILEWLVL